MKVIGKNILLKKIEEQITNDVGIIYTKSLDKNIRYAKAEVIQSGESVDVCKNKDIIYFDVAQSSEIRIEEKKYTVIDEKAIVAII